MPMWWSGDGGWVMWLTMSLVMLAFWGFLIWGVVTLIRGSQETRRRQEPDPERILAERYAAGEIDDDEYAARLGTLRGTRSAHVPPLSGARSRRDDPR